MKIFFLFYLVSHFLSTSTAEAFAYSSGIVRSGERFLGSSVVADVSARGDAVFYLTSSHVVEGSSHLTVNGAEARVYFSEPETDLTILAARSSITNLIPIIRTSIEGPLNHEISFPEAMSTFHLNAQDRLQSKVYLEIDGVDPDTLRLSRRSLLTPVVKTLASGIPGRDLMGSLIQFEGVFRPGVSGSMVYAYVNQNNNLVYNGTTNPCGASILCPWRIRQVGMITLVDPERNLVAAVSSRSIQAALLRMQRAGQKAPDRQLIPGGIRYLRSGIVHLRSGGSAPILGRSLMAGASRGGNAGASRGGDGGGRPRRGEVFLTQSSSIEADRWNWRSGIILAEYPALRWLHLQKVNGFWTEFEAFNEKWWLENDSAYEGVFEEQNRIYRTSALAHWPQWINPLFFTLNQNGCTPFVAQRWVEAVRGDPIHPEQRLEFCLRSSESEQTLLIKTNGRNLFELKIAVLRSELTSIGIRQPLDFQASSFIGGIRQPMLREGFRTYKNEHLRVEIDFNSGFYIERREGRVTSIYIGPTK